MTVRNTAALLRSAQADLRSDPVRQFLGDVSVPGMLHAAVWRSPHPHARIVAISLDAARQMPGVQAVISAAELPTAHRLGIAVRDRPALAVDVVRHVGEPVAAVAANTPEQAAAALAAIEVRFELLPVLDDPMAALAADAPPLHPGGNLLRETRFDRGALADAFSRADVVVEQAVTTPRQAHAYLELESALVIPGPGPTLRVLAPCQGPHGVQAEMAALLDMPVKAIEVVGSPLGGSYGGKDEVHAQAIAAMLALRCARPVKLIWHRADHFSAGMKRHPAHIRMRSACTADGRLLAHEVDLVMDTGAYASHGPEVLHTAHEHAGGPYEWPALSVRGRLVYTNNGISGAFRGFGALQVSTALELQIDALARRTGIDPIEFRRRNLVLSRSVGPLGQAIAPLPDLDAVLEQLAPAVKPAMAPSRAAPSSAARHLRGTGVSLVIKSEGFAIGGPNAAGGRLQMCDDGTVELRVGLADMGQGLRDAARTLLRAALDAVPTFHKTPLRVVAGMTEGSPAAGPTSASRGTHILAKLVATLVPALSLAIARSPSRVVSVEAEVAMPASFSEHGPAHAIFGACGARAEVSIDRWTGRTRVERVTVVPSVGPVVSPAGFLAQVEGSAVMAAGFVLLEDLPAVGGHFRATNLDGYFVPTLADAPVVEVQAIDAAISADDLMPRGIGEIALDAVASAIATAVADAVGCTPAALPVNPAWVRDRLDARTGVGS